MSGADDDFYKKLGDFLRRRDVQGSVDGDNSSERAYRIAAQGFLPCSPQVFSFGNPAGIGMFDDGDGRLLALGNQLKGGIRVIQVVVAEFFSLNLFCCCYAGTARTIGIEGSLLMRIFTVTKRFAAIPRKK